MSAVTTYSTRAKPEGCMWLCTGALYFRLPCLGCVSWFVSYKTLIVPQGNIMILPSPQGNIMISLATVYIHTGGALIYVIGRIQLLLMLIVSRSIFKLDVPSVSQDLEDFEVSGSERTVDTVVILILGIIVIIIAGTIVSVVLLIKKG